MSSTSYAATPIHILWARHWLDTHAVALQTRYFKHCSLPHDWEDWTQEVLIYLWQSESFVSGNPGWRGWVKRAILCRAINRVRDEILRVSKSGRLVGDMDRYAASEVDLRVASDVNAQVSSLGYLTKQWSSGHSLQTLARTMRKVSLKNKRRRRSYQACYQRIAVQVRADRLAARELVYSG